VYKKSWNIKIMSLGIIGNTASRGIVLDCIRKPTHAFINYFATSVPIHSGSLVTTGITSGTFDLYRLVGPISSGNSALYAVHIKNLTMNPSTTSGAISLGPNYAPLTESGVSFNTSFFHSYNGSSSPISFNIGTGTTFTLTNGSTPVSNYSFCVIFGGVS
jgi:hypothetical protein